MSYLEQIKLMIRNEPTLTNIETDSLMTKAELILNQNEVKFMSSNEKILAIINHFKNLAVQDQRLIIEVLQEAYNKQGIEAKEELLRQQHHMAMQAEM